MICYVLDQTNHFDLFLARSSDFSDAPRSEKPELTGNGRVTTAGWSRDGWTYLVIGEGDDAHLKKFMETKDLAERRIKAVPPGSRNFFGAFHGIYAKVTSRKVEETFLAQAMGLRFLGISSPDNQPKL